MTRPFKSFRDTRQADSQVVAQRKAQVAMTPAGLMADDSSSPEMAALVADARVGNGRTLVRHIRLCVSADLTH
jgi:hypothetical protein